MVLNDDGTVTVTKDEELSVVLPEGGAHDLQPVTGDVNKLIVSAAAHVYIVDKTNGTCTPIIEEGHVKGVGFFKNGDMIYMYWDGVNDNSGGGWNTTYLTYVPADGELTTVPSDQGRFYKCRVWYTDYQP